MDNAHKNFIQEPKCIIESWHSLMENIYILYFFVKVLDFFSVDDQSNKQEHKLKLRKIYQTNYYLKKYTRSLHHAEHPGWRCCPRRVGVDQTNLSRRRQQRLVYRPSCSLLALGRRNQRAIWPRHTRDTRHFAGCSYAIASQFAHACPEINSWLLATKPARPEGP